MGSACWESGDARWDALENKVAITPSAVESTAVAGFWLGRFEAQGVIADEAEGAKDCGQSVSQSVRGVRYFE